jgi:hypothetical protein
MTPRGLSIDGVYHLDMSVGDFHDLDVASTEHRVPLSYLNVFWCIVHACNLAPLEPFVK